MGTTVVKCLPDAWERQTLRPMSIQLYNTLSRDKQPFEPLNEGKVGLYVCGPTVYSDCHIGHLMGPVLFDAIARWFRARGYSAYHL